MQPGTREHPFVADVLKPAHQVTQQINLQLVARREIHVAAFGRKRMIAALTRRHTVPASPNPVPAEIRARFPVMLGMPGFKTTKSDSSSSAIPWALANRSLISVIDLRNPSQRPSSRASTTHGKLVVSTRPFTTAPGQPKTTASTASVCMLQKLTNDFGRPGIMRAGKDFDLNRLQAIRRSLKKCKTSVGPADIARQDHQSLLQWR